MGRQPASREIEAGSMLSEPSLPRDIKSKKDKSDNRQTISGTPAPHGATAGKEKRLQDVADDDRWKARHAIGRHDWTKSSW